MSDIALTLCISVIALAAIRRIRYAYQHTVGVRDVCLNEEHCGCPDCDPDDLDIDDRMFVARAVLDQVETRLEILGSERKQDPLMEDCRDLIERLMWTPSTEEQRRACDWREFWWTLIGIDRDGHYWMPAPHLEPSAHECVRCHRVTMDWMRSSI